MSTFYPQPAGVTSLNQMLGKIVGIDQDLSAAACIGRDPELFYAAEDDDYQRHVVKRICVTCPVRTACLTGALQRNEPAGVWGGLTTTERKQLKRRGAA